MTTATQHPNKELVTSILKNLSLSTMSGKEKTMWMMMIPGMDETELNSLNDLLKEEVSELTDLYLSVQS